jgi:hypothetical protein
LVAVLGTGWKVCLGDEPLLGNVRDVGKGTVEAPTKALLAATRGKQDADRRAQAVDRPKEDIERPAKTLVRGSLAAKGDAFANPKVAPGQVRWHPSLDAACAAARKSGKPVLLFQMMGKLDEHFC